MFRVRWLALQTSHIAVIWMKIRWWTSKLFFDYFPIFFKNFFKKKSFKTFKWNEEWPDPLIWFIVVCSLPMFLCPPNISSTNRVPDFFNSIKTIDCCVCFTPPKTSDVQFLSLTHFWIFFLILKPILAPALQWMTLMCSPFALFH